MQVKWLFRIGIMAAAIASLYFSIKLDFNYAVLSMVALFSLTNGSRARSFRQQGMERESKWMLWLSIFFGVAFILLVIYSVAS